MSYHRIHLRGPWEFTWLSAVPLPSPLPGSQIPGLLLDERRVRMPTDWRHLFGPLAGRARFLRRFQWPTNLEDDERAILVFLGVGGHGSVSLNNEPLGEIADDTAEFDVTDHLMGTNVLVVELDADPEANRDQPFGLWAPVAIEIRQPDNLE